MLAIFEPMAEVQAMLHDCLAAGRSTTASNEIAKVQAAMSESDLLRATFDVSYFPLNTPPLVARREAKEDWS